MAEHQRLESLSVDPVTDGATTATVPANEQESGPSEDAIMPSAPPSEAVVTDGGPESSTVIEDGAQGTAVQMTAQQQTVQQQAQQPMVMTMQPNQGVFARIGQRGVPKMEDFLEQSQDLAYRSDRGSMDPNNTIKSQCWKLFWVSLLVIPLAIYAFIQDYESDGHYWDDYWWYNQCRWNNFTRVLLNVENSTHWDTHFCIVDNLVLTAENISGHDSSRPLTLLECRNECAELYERAVHTYYWDFSVGAFVNKDDGHCYCFVNPYLEYQKCVDRYTDNYYSWDYQGWCKHSQPSGFNTTCIAYDEFINETAEVRYGYGLESSQHWSADIFSCQWGGKYNYYYCNENGCPDSYWDYYYAE